MAWTAPMTASANATFNAADWNTHIRDNLLETEPAKATTVGSYLVSTGANALAQRATSSAFVGTRETTTSTSFTDLATSGPAVTVTTGTKALVMTNCAMSGTVDFEFWAASFAVSGATTIAADDEWAVIEQGSVANDNFSGNPFDQHNRRGVSRLVTLTAGSNTFTMKYRVGSGTGHFHNREIIVMPF